MTDKVLLYGMNYAPEFAGVGRYSGEIAEHLAARGDEVMVVTTPMHYPGWRVCKPYVNGRFYFEISNGVNIIRCPLLLREQMGGIWRMIAPLTFALTSAPIVLWQMVRRRPDVVLLVVPTLFGAPILLFGGWLIGARTVAHMQDLEVDAAFAVGHLAKWSWLKRLGGLFERAVLGRFGQIITISDRMAEKIAQKGIARQKIAVIRNWVDVDQIRPLAGESPYREELGFKPGDFIVEYCGNIGRKQGLGVLFEAAERLAGHRDIHFVVAGEGPAKAELRAHYGHLTNIRFLPFQPNERLCDLLGLADLHALPQDANAADLVLPSKLGGMLASGKPIVTMCDPDTELAQFLGDCVTMVSPGNAAALAEAILAASKQTRRNADAGLERGRLADSLSKREGLPRFAQALYGPKIAAVSVPASTPAQAPRV